MGILNEFNIAFVSGALPRGRVRLFGVEGHEELSSLFSFELFLAREEGGFSDEELDALLHAPCAVALGATPGDVVHGVLSRIRTLDTSGTRPPRYVATMVPPVWALTLTRSNRIFQNLTVPDLVALILTQYGLKPGEDFDVSVAGGYLPREYIVQYEETDWDFIQRWLESEGLFYFFEHGGARNKLVITDSNAYATPIAPPAAIRYRARNDLSSGGVSSVWEWTLDQRRIPARVAVFDYNHLFPQIRLVGKATVDARRGFGTMMYYNEHFLSVEEGTAIAGIRAERHLCERRVFAGWTDCPRFRVGHVFELTDHHDGSGDGEYLITAIHHRVGIERPDPDRDIEHRGEVIEHYKARFRAIPEAVQFRPERRVPWPVIHGVMHGHIEADTAGEYAQIDELGRYKVRMPFDSGNAVGSQASCWIRMAQPYSGPGYGSHYPLHKGVEVLVAHIDGDPDRPLIVGTVPHGRTVSPVSKLNATQSVIQTASGIRIEFEDLQGK
ncbi:MAG: type VI secretion system tip protein VgrG [Phycisphaerales bacterium]|nr:type VI secretion system tip protein VgrG [Phycisphaerales bacterium]